MALKVSEGHYLLAEAAGLWAEAAYTLMVSVLSPVELDLTVLADKLSMGFLLMFLPVTLGDDFPALLALVVVPRAADLVHAELGELNLPLASGALLCGLASFHVYFFKLLGYFTNRRH